MKKDGGGNWNRAARRSGGSRAERLIVSTAPKEFIVKVQLTLMTTAPVRQVVVYNEDRSLEWKGDACKEILDLMGDEPKAFFWATVQGGQFMIERPAKWQDW